MSHAATGIHFEVDQGPDWLFIRIHPAADGAFDAEPVAEPIWSIVEQYRVHRVVLELDLLHYMPSYLIGQFLMLFKRLHTHGGMLRLCGLSANNEAVIHACRLDNCFPCYSDRADAVMGHLPHAPR
jgi:anti-anti-sigma factor